MPALQSNSKTLTALNQTVDLDVRDADVGAITITGTFVATLTLQVSNNGTDFFPVNATPSNSATSASTATAPGAFTLDVRPWATLRVVCTAFTSGSAVVTMSVKQQS